MKKSDFSRIIGFDSVKEELSIIGDMFNDPEKYEQIGAEIPKGILLYGEPGIGKTTFAYSFMEASGVSSYIIRRNKNNSAFIEEIGNTFEEAKNNTPSIILLDDLDKFTKDGNSIEEYSVVQACIDSVSKQNVLVMATVNEIDRIPSSLIRSGRFDRIINMSLSIGDIVSGNHWKYFLNNSDIDIEVDEDDISKMFYLVSPSNIKNIINDSLIIAAYNGENVIKRDYLIDAYLKNERREYTSSNINNEEELMRTAYHEAGHAVVMEILNPGGVSMISAVGQLLERPGFVKFCKPHKEEEYALYVALAGKLSEERYSNKSSIGAALDLKELWIRLDMLLQDGYYGLQYVSNEKSHESLKENVYNKKIEIINRITEEVGKILDENWNLVEAIAQELIERKTLLASDVKKYS